MRLKRWLLLGLVPTAPLLVAAYVLASRGGNADGHAPPQAPSNAKEAAPRKPLLAARHQREPLAPTLGAMADGVQAKPGVLLGAELSAEELEPEADAQYPPTLVGGSSAEIVADIVASGRDTSKWTLDARTVFKDIARELPAAISRGLRFGDAGCYQRGCVVEVTYADAAAYDESKAGFWTNPKLEAWKGLKACTALEKSDTGQLRATWILKNSE